MRLIAFFVISSGWVLAGPLEDLASPSQQVRDEAAGELRKTFVLPSRKTWDELAASIKPGDTLASALDRLTTFNAKRGQGAGSGRTTNVSYRLDGAWILWIASVTSDVNKTGAERTTVTNVSLQEAMQQVWVAPPEGFSGTWTTYYINGQRSHEVHYANGRYSGKFTTFRSDGSKACVQYNGPNGAEGEDTGYFPSGRIAYRGTYKSGNKVGTWTWYNEDGCVQSTEEHPEQAR